MNTPTRLIATAAIIGATGFASVGAVSASAPPPPPDTEPTIEITPAGSDPTAAPDTESTPAAGGGAVTIIDESGVELAVITVNSMEEGWTGFADDDAPSTGAQYVRMNVTVESRTARGVFDVDADNFILQDDAGFLTDSESVPTPEQDAADEDVVDDAVLAGGETIELDLTFSVVNGSAPMQVFYRNGSNQLVTVHLFG